MTEYITQYTAIAFTISLFVNIVQAYKIDKLKKYIYNNKKKFSS